MPVPPDKGNADSGNGLGTSRKGCSVDIALRMRKVMTRRCWCPLCWTSDTRILGTRLGTNAKRCSADIALSVRKVVTRRCLRPSGVSFFTKVLSCR